MADKIRCAVILSGAGMRDGSEIHESVAALFGIVNNGGEYQVFAPDIMLDEINHITGQPTGNKRSVAMEAARIARGNVMDLTYYNPEEFDMLVIPGGQGAIKNLSNFAQKGAECEVNDDVKAAIVKTHKLGKPIVALCIAPVVVAKVIKGASVTVGNDKNVGALIVAMGGKTQDKAATEVAIDVENKIVTTPCYMLAKNVAEVVQGVDKAIKSAIELI